MPELTDALMTIMKVFHDRSEKEGNQERLTQRQMRDLFKDEFGDVLGTADDQAAVDRFFKKMDKDQDNTVDLLEFMDHLKLLMFLCLLKPQAK